MTEGRTHEIYTHHRQFSPNGWNTHILGLRIPVATIVAMMADGLGKEEILNAYPDLCSGVIREALKYATEAVRERELPLTAQPCGSLPIMRYLYSLPRD
ncbi:MAG: DUF433 domain-containing protein [Hyphomicrobiaceae bacterium]